MNFKKNYQIDKQIIDYINYLTNTNPLLIRYKVLEEIETFLTNNPNKELENILDRTYYLFLLLEFVFNNHQKLENLTHKEKLLIEKYFLMDMENFDKSKQEFYLDYLKNGLSTNIILEFVKLIINKEELFQSAHIEYLKLEENLNKKFKNIDYKIVSDKTFQENVACIQTIDTKEIFKVNINGNTEKIEIPENYNYVRSINFKNNILTFECVISNEEFYKTIYMTDYIIIPSDYLSHFEPLISKDKFLVYKKDDKTFIVLDANDQNYKKIIPLYKINRFLKLKLKKLKTIDSCIENIEFIDNLVIFDIQYYINYSLYFINVSYDINTDKFKVLKEIPKSFSSLNKKEKEEKIENYSLLFDGCNYQFINIEKELDCPYMSIINKTHEIVVNNNLKTKKIDYKNYKKK